jgi:hypothetical protein
MDRSLKAAQGAALVSHPTGVAVPAHFTPHRVPEVGECPRVALLAKPAVQLHQGPPQTLFRGFALQPCLPCSALPPIAREAEKVKSWHRPVCPEGIAQRFVQKRP